MVLLFAFFLELGEVFLDPKSPGWLLSLMQDKKIIIRSLQVSRSFLEMEGRGCFEERLLYAKSRLSAPTGLPSVV